MPAVTNSTVRIKQDLENIMKLVRYFDDLREIPSNMLIGRLPRMKRKAKQIKSKRENKRKEKQLSKMKKRKENLFFLYFLLFLFSLDIKKRILFLLFSSFCVLFCSNLFWFPFLFCNFF